MRRIPLLATSIVLAALVNAAGAAEDCRARILHDDTKLSGGSVRFLFTVLVSDCDACFGEFNYSYTYEDTDGNRHAVNAGGGWGSQDSTKMIQTYDDENIGSGSKVISVNVSTNAVTRCVCTKPAASE